MMTPEERCQLAELFREDDRLRAEDADWAARTALVQKFGADGVLYRTGPENTPAPAADNARIRSSNGAASDWSGWEKWLRGHLDNERAKMHEAVAEGMAVFFHEQLTPIDRTFAELRAENIELKGLITDALSRFAKIDDAAKELASEIGWLRQQWQADKRETQIRNEAIVERSGRIAELQRENAAAHADLKRQQLEQAFAERDHRIEHIETRLGMLLKFLGADLPRGFLGQSDGS